MEIKFRPMLGKTLENVNDIQYPVLVSTKLDGIRCIFKDGEMLSRSLKPIPNKQLQKKFEHLKEITRRTKVILDGELYAHDLTFQEITSLCMTEDFMDDKTFNKMLKEDKFIDSYIKKDIDMGEEFISFDNPLKFYIFDFYEPYEPHMTFEKRFDNYYNQTIWSDVVVPLKQNTINNPEELEEYFKFCLDLNFEGAIIRNLNSPYKFGRSTLKEGGLLKMKPFKTFDAKIMDVFERLENTNESFKNELGESTKRNTKENKAHTGIAGGFLVDYMGKELKVTLTGPESSRRHIWDNKDDYIDKWIEFKGMEIGSKDVPRHPVFIRFRTDRD